MGNLKRIAKEFYSITDDLNIYSFHRYWTPNKIKKLIQYDILHFVSLIYKISDHNDKQSIITGVGDFFGFNNGKKIVEKFLETHEYKRFLPDLFDNLPFVVDLMYEHDRSSKDVEGSYMFLELIEVIIFAVVYPDGEASVDERLLLIRAYLDYIKNRLVSSGIEEKHFISIKGVRNINDLMDSYEKEHLLSSEDDANVELNFRYLVKNAVVSKEIYFLSESGKKEKGINPHPIKDYELALECVERIAAWAEDCGSGSPFISIRTCMEPISFNNSLYGYDLSAYRKGNNNNYNSFETITEADILWNLIDKQKDQVNIVFPAKCHLTKTILSNNSKGYSLKTGRMTDCFETAWNNLHQLQDYERYVIQYGKNSWDIFNVPNDPIFALKKLLKMVRDITGVIDSMNPEAKKGTVWSYINDENYIYLWESLKHNDDKKYHSNDYYMFHRVSDSESKLCYEQGKKIENIIWIGGQLKLIPEANIRCCTHSVMNYAQLRYYLYWRTCFRTGDTPITGYRSYYYLYIYELIADLGPYTAKQRLKQLERVYLKYSEEYLYHIPWIGEYADDHGLLITDEVIRRKAYARSSKSYSEEAVETLKNRKYVDTFPYICKKSAWKLNSSFIKKTQSKKQIEKIVTAILPELHELFNTEGISLADVLIGRENTAHKKETLYNGSVWNAETSNIFRNTRKSSEVLKNTPGHIFVYKSDADVIFSNEECDDVQYCDPYLSEYLLKCTEMKLRAIVGYNTIAIPKKLGEKIEEDTEYELNYFLPNKEYKLRFKRYIALYDEIEKRIQNAVYYYCLFHQDEIERIKQIIPNTVINPKGVIHNKPIQSQIIDFINSSTEESKIEELLNLYDKLPASAQDSKHKLYSSLIWDYWILHNCSYGYESLSSRVFKNEWYIIEKSAIEKRQYEDAISYFKSLHNLYTGEICAYINTGIITDCICLTFHALEKWFAFWNIDIADVVLGEWSERKWDIFNVEKKINKHYEKDITVNINEIEIYRYNSAIGKATVCRRSYSMESKNIIIGILRRIENELRKHAGVKKLLIVNNNIGGLVDYPGFSDACTSINHLISSIVRLVLLHNSPRNNQLKSEAVLITDTYKRSYCFEKTDNPRLPMPPTLDIFIRDIINKYYQFPN